MTYKPATLSIATSTLSSKRGSIHRKYTDSLRQYRAYQGAIARPDPDHYTPAELEHRARYLASKLDYYRAAVRSLSYQHRAYKRAMAVLEAEEFQVRPTGMTGPQLTEATEVVRGVMRNAHNIPQDQFAPQIAYQLSRKGFHQ